MDQNMRQKCFKTCLSAIIFSAALAVASLPAAEDNELSPSKNYLMAYESMSTADWLLKRGMKEDAATLYNESLKLFQKLISEYPTWQTNLVTFRINYCLKGLSRALNSNNTATDRAVATSRQKKKSPLSGKSARPTVPDATAGTGTELDGKITQALRLEQASDFQEALQFYQSVLAQSNQNAPALAGAGRCFLQLGQVGPARDLLFQWSVVPSPDNGINALLALILCHDRQFAKAIQLAEILVNDDSSNATAHVILGVALAGMGQTGQAISEMQKALALNPRLKEAHYNLAWLMINKYPKKKITASKYYLNALKFGAAPDPALAKLLKK